MKIKFTFLALMIFSISVQAQNDEFNHFEINANAMFWTPVASHLKSVNSITTVSNSGTSSSTGSFSGYGSTLAPEIQVKYFFKNNLGISLGLYLMNLDNELYVQETDTTFSSNENIAEIDNLTLGLAGRWNATPGIKIFYEVGVNMVLNYDLQIMYSSHISDPPDLEAIGSAIGLYGKTGFGIKLFSDIFFNAGLIYSYVPVELEYSNNDGTQKINEKTDLGGVALQIGLSYNF